MSDPGRRPERERDTGARVVKTIVILVVILVVFLILMSVIAGGGHGPQRHL